jgi:hypothetical protein
MLNLIETGLAGQQAYLDTTPSYFRIVRPDEELASALLEAISHGAFVWANPSKRKTVISTIKPHGDWRKVHGVHHLPDFGPEAA